MTEQKQSGIWAWDLVKCITLASILLFVGILFFKGFNEEGTRLIIRWTARIAVFLFCLAFSASSLHLIVRNSFTFWIAMNRKYWGISFAIIHLIHLLFLLLLQYYFHPVFERAAAFSLFAGGMAYLFLVLMLLTSFDYFANMLSRKMWKGLHLLGGHWIWLIFMSSYWKRAIVDYSYLPVALLLVAVMGLRLFAKIQKTSNITS